MLPTRAWKLLCVLLRVSEFSPVLPLESWSDKRWHFLVLSSKIAEHYLFLRTPLSPPGDRWCDVLGLVPSGNASKDRKRSECYKVSVFLGEWVRFWKYCDVNWWREGNPFDLLPTERKDHSTQLGLLKFDWVDTFHTFFFSTAVRVCTEFRQASPQASF